MDSDHPVVPHSARVHIHPGTIDGFQPPNHFNCRSILIPITTYDEGWQYLLDFQRTLGQDISRMKASIDRGILVWYHTE